MNNQQANEADTTQLEDVRIEDAELEALDNQTKAEKKAAKKRAKLLLTPEEKKRLKRKKIIIFSAVASSVLVLLFVVPITRWPILNAVGFRGELSVLVQERNSNETISDAEVVLNGTTVGSTDNAGQLKISNIQLGDTSIVIEKSGYSRQQATVEVGLGGTRFNSQIEAIGVKVVFKVKDWLTGSPIESAKLTAGESTSITDKKGQASLIVPPSDEKTTVTVEAKGYLKRTVELRPGVLSTEVTLVADAKNYFISKRDGKFDIFSSSIDGSAQKKIIEATGKENQNLLNFSVHRNNKTAILIANREGKTTNGRMVAGVYAVNLEKAELTKIDEGSDVTLLDWAGDVVLYSKTNPSLNYDAKNVTQLMSYKIGEGAATQQVAANYFQLALVAANSLVYMPADAYRPIANAQLTSKDLVSGATRTYLKDKQLSYGLQSRYGVVHLETSDGEYHEINVMNGSTQRVDRQPSSAKQFGLDQSGKNIAWAEQRDGKGVLLTRVLSSEKDNAAVRIPGLTSPVRWVSSDLVVARIATNQETADYVVNIKTSDFAKIVDVSNVGGYLQL